MSRTNSPPTHTSAASCSAAATSSRASPAESARSVISGQLRATRVAICWASLDPEEPPAAANIIATTTALAIIGGPHGRSGCGPVASSPVAGPGGLDGTQDSPRSVKTRKSHASRGEIVGEFSTVPVPSNMKSDRPKPDQT